MTSSTEELDLLERVFLRLGAAESDQQLENTIKRFLIPVLLKLSSNNEGVRKKVMELLVHLNKRIRRRPSVQLPVEALLAQYTDPKASSFLINFSIVYIKLGYPRLPLHKQHELVPVLLAASCKKPKLHQDSLFFLVTSIVGDIILPNDVQKKREIFRLDENPELMKNLCSFMLDVLLLPYPYVSQTPDTPEPAEPIAVPPPGMSEYGYKRVTCVDPPMTPERLERMKQGILKFLSNGMFQSEEVICHFVIGSSDTRFTVTNIADNELRRISGSVDWTNTTVASRLFHIYLGTPEVPPEKNHLIPLANRVVAANTRIRLKILPYLSRLENEAILYPASVHVVFNTIQDRTTGSKLQLLALNFALGIIKKADGDLLNKIGGMLYKGLLKLVWSREESPQLRVAGFTILGQIVKRLPRIINKNLVELQMFFDNLSCEQPEVRMAVRDALLIMIDAYQLLMRGEVCGDGSSVGTGTNTDTSDSNTDISDSNTDTSDSNTDTSDSNTGTCVSTGTNDNERMELDPKQDSDDGEKRSRKVPSREVTMLAFLAAQVDSRDSFARLVAVKYISAVFGPDHVPSRYLLLLCAGDSNLDVAEFAIKSLYIELEEEEREEGYIVFPDFVKMVAYIHGKADCRLQNENQKVLIENVVSPFNEITFNESLVYLRLCLARSASMKIANREVISHPCAYSPFIRQYVLETHGRNPDMFEYYLNLIDQLLLPAVSALPVACLVEVVGTCPELFASRYMPNFDQFMTLLGHSKEEMRDNVALLLSILMISEMDEEQLAETTRILLKKLGDKSADMQHGAILALGYIVNGKFTQLMSSGVAYDPELWPLHDEIVMAIAKHFDSPNPILISATCIAFGQIMKVAPLPLPKGPEKGLTKFSILKKLLDIARNGKLSSKTRERAIQACGMMCLGENFPFSKELLRKFLDISKQTKDIDTHFFIGESMIMCLEGISSAEKRNAWIVKECEYEKPPITEENLTLLDSLLNELCANASIPSPSVRQSTAVYLLSIIKKLHFIQNVRDKLPAIQAAFMELLSENNDVVQDIASKGLALVYEHTSPENRRELVAKLLDQLLSGRRSVQQVSKDSKIFEEGQLGASPSGGNLSTYKELCSLASELNQPDLIYKFMHLANHNMIWNSKKGAAFGFHTIALQAQDELTEYLPEIIPRLYRYQYDPTPKIQQTMSNIWRSLVKEPNKTLCTYYREIVDDLIANITSNQWRVRISCAQALADFFRGDRSIVDAKEKLPTLFQSLYRVMDDVHEGTRLAAQSTAKILSKLCINACDGSSGLVDKEFLETILAIFIAGITNAIPEVRSLCLLTISQLVNSAGEILKPNLTTLIGALLDAAGELESVGLSYLSNQYSARSQTQDMIDSVRANITKSHFTTQTVTKCVQYIELEMMEVLAPKTVEVLKGVNLGSKVAAAHLVVLLAHHLGRSMEAYTGRFLSALVNGLVDRNNTIRKTFAFTLGQILHVARPLSLERLFAKLSQWYYEKDDVNIRTAIGFALHSSAQYNGELLKVHYPVLVPLIFFAMHAQKVEGEDNAHVVVWEELWNDVPLSYETSVKQQMGAILKCVEDALSSPSWTRKAQAGNCIQTIATKIGGSIESSDRDKFINMSLKALQGKTFPGKENIIKGLAKLCTKSKADLKESSNLCHCIVETLLRECGKSDAVYRRHAVEALGSVLETFDGMDFFDRVYEISQTIIRKLNEKPQEKVDAQDMNALRNEKYCTMGIIYVCLGKSWPKNKETQVRHEDHLLNECCKALENSPRDIQVSVLIALHCYVEKLHYFNLENRLTEEEEKRFKEILKKICTALHYSLGIKKHTRLRKEALNILTTLGRKLSAAERNDELRFFTDALKNRIQELEKDTSPEVRTRLTDVKEIFKK